MQNKFLFLLLMVCIPFIGCKQSNGTDMTLTVNQDAPNAADGFNLEQFHKLLLEEKPANGQWDAKFLSDLVNRPDINNLDLNNDGKVDQIFVEPFGSESAPGFQLYCQVPDGEGGTQEQEIAKIVIEKEADGKASMHVSGNEQVYGAGAHYHSHGLTLGDYLLLRWMFTPAYPLYGGFYGGWYGGPGMYGGRTVVSTTTYRNTINNRNQTYNQQNRSAPTAQKSGTAPAAVKNAAVKQRTAATGIKSKLNNPTASQRSFKSQTDASRAKGSGFGSSSERSSGSNTSSNSSRRSSGGGFGSSGSGFGSSSSRSSGRSSGGSRGGGGK